jgi:antitoxin MazE
MDAFFGDRMIVQFKKWGNELGLRIPDTYAREIAAEDGKQAELKIQGGSLVVTPLANGPIQDLDALISKITPDNLHGEISTGFAVGNEFS